MLYDRAIYNKHCVFEKFSNEQNQVRAKKIKKANKSERWMPRLWEAMKDVISCDKLGGGANNL